MSPAMRGVQQAVMLLQQKAHHRQQEHQRLQQRQLDLRTVLLPGYALWKAAAPHMVCACVAGKQYFEWIEGRL